MAALAAYVSAALVLSASVQLDTAPLSRGVASFTAAPVARALSGFSGFTSTHAAEISQLRVAAAASISPDIGDHWWERLHVLPRRIRLGAASVPPGSVRLFSSYRIDDRTLTTVTHGLGSALVVGGLPTLPYEMPALSGLDLTLTFLMGAAEMADADDSLDFEFDVYTLELPIEGIGVAMLAHEPETPVVERLSWLTDVMPRQDQTEMRVALRRTPRQSFDLEYAVESGLEKQSLDNLLFDRMGSPIGLPVWIEPSILSEDVDAGASWFPVDSTDNADFRVGGLAIVFEEWNRWEVFEIQSMDAASLSATSPTALAFSAGARVMPVRRAVSAQTARTRRSPVGLASTQVTLRVLDNDVDLSSASGWDTYAGKVLLSGANYISGALVDTLERRIVEVDGGAGAFNPASLGMRAARITAKTFAVASRADLWAVRRLLHYLRGGQVSFYLPTFDQDLVLAAPYTSGGASISVEYCGYARYVAARSPKGDIRITLLNGDTHLRSITAASESGGLETLTLSSSISASFDVEDVVRIEFVERMRIASDDVVIEHEDANGTARVGFATRAST